MILGRNIIILGVFLAVLAGCGQKSQITPSVEAKTTADAYGDGEHIIRSVVMPLSDQVIDDYKSPISKVNSLAGGLAGGFARLFMNLGAGIGMGRSQMSLFQPVPEIPREYIKGASLKRVFFYIEPTIGKRKPNFFQRIFQNRQDVDFKFLDKLAVKISPHKVQNVHTWIPHYETRSIRAGEYTPLQTLFENVDENDIYGPAGNPEELKELVIVKYASKDREKFIRNSEFGTIFIMNTKQPIKTKRFIEGHARLKHYINRIHVLNGKRRKNLPHNVPTPGTLLIELEKDPVYEEGFKNVFSEADEAAQLSKLGVDLIEQCTEYTCMDMKLPEEVDIIPLVSRGNSIKIDTFMDAKKVPESFQLKGFLEFEVKVKLNF